MKRSIPLGLVGAGLAVGAALEHRTVRRMRQLPDPEAGADVGPIAGRPTTVLASDGVPLHVEEVGAADAPLTFVFAHGFCVTGDSWVFQARGLADLGRLVFYDQRAHGRSGPAEVGRCTIEALGDDLFRVLAQRVPTGPVVLVGHSMGGMSVMALAESHPELFGDRVVAVALLSTSTGGIAKVTLGIPSAMVAVARRVLPGVAVGIRHAPPLLERARWRGSDLSWLLTRRIGFGRTEVGPSVVSFLETMIADTPIPVVTAFLPTLFDHDKLAAAAVLHNTPTLVLVGDQDLMTPLEHSRILADALPEATFVVEEGAGHAVALERPEAVNGWIRELVARAVATAPAGPGAGRPGERGGQRDSGDGSRRDGAPAPASVPVPVPGPRSAAPAGSGTQPAPPEQPGFAEQREPAGQPPGSTEIISRPPHQRGDDDE